MKNCKISKLSFLFVFVFTVMGVSFSQLPPLQLRPLTQNPFLQDRPQTVQVNAGSEILLPFFDDFSQTDVCPAPRLWADKVVYINNSYPYYPPTFGVATFDALDENGEVYSHASILGYSFPADSLTSLPIRLDSIFYPVPKALSPADSIYLSFYFQPGGGGGPLDNPSRRGFTPKGDDSLTLEIYNHVLQMWVKVWAAGGQSLEEFCPNFFKDTGVQDKHYFRKVMIPLDKPHYFKKNFQFRFRAYSSIDPNFYSGGGQWHLDYVYIDVNRSINESGVQDLAFVESQSSLLYPYSQVPPQHFTSSMIKPQNKVLMTNLDKEMLSCRYQYILSENQVPLYTIPQTGEANANIYPFVTHGYTTNPNLAELPFTYTFPNLKKQNEDGKSQVFEVSQILKLAGQNDLIASNDTLRFFQVFGSDFAYDDGGAEAGIGLTYKGGKMAYKFSLQQPDTLTKVAIYFNRSLKDANEKGFKIAIWASENGVPGRCIHQSSLVFPKFTNELNAFSSYVLSEDVILPAGDFFAGIEQESKTYLNFGFDQNTNSRDYLYYYYYNTSVNAWEWSQSLYHGSWMFRPFFGRAAKLSVDENPTLAPVLNVYPNPVYDGVLNIQGARGKGEIQLVDQVGRILKSGPLAETLDVSGLKSGLYILRVYIAETAKIYTHKINIISN